MNATGPALVTSLYLDLDLTCIGTKRIVVVVFATFDGRNRTFVAYGIDPDRKKIVFWLKLQPSQLAALVDVLLRDVKAVIAVFRKALEHAERTGRREEKLLLAGGKLILSTDKPVGSGGSGRKLRIASGGPKLASAASFDESSDSSLIVIRDPPPPDTGPKAIAVGVALAADADLANSEQ